jgi:hypothetical protein
MAAPTPSQVLVYVVVRLLGDGSEILGAYASAAGTAAKADAEGGEVVLPLET